MGATSDVNRCHLGISTEKKEKDMAVTFEYENEFVEYVKDYITDKLDGMEGYECCGCDLPFEITLDVNNEPATMWANTDEAMTFMAKYPQAALATVDDVQWSFGADEIPHMFKSWQTFAFFMLDQAVGNLVHNLPYVDEHWDDEFELTADVIERLKNEVKDQTTITY